MGADPVGGGWWQKVGEMVLKAALKSGDPLAHGRVYGWVTDDHGQTRKNKGRPTYITISDNV